MAEFKTKEEITKRLKEIDDTLPTREKALNAELIPIMKRYGFTLGSQAFLTPDGRITSAPKIFDVESLELNQKLGAIMQEEARANMGNKTAETESKKKGKKSSNEDEDDVKQL